MIFVIMPRKHGNHYVLILDRIYRSYQSWCKSNRDILQEAVIRIMDREDGQLPRNSIFYSYSKLIKCFLRRLWLIHRQKQNDRAGEFWWGVIFGCIFRYWRVTVSLHVHLKFSGRRFSWLIKKLGEVIQLDDIIFNWKLVGSRSIQIITSSRYK